MVDMGTLLCDKCMSITAHNDLECCSRLSSLTVTSVISVSLIATVLLIKYENTLYRLPFVRKFSYDKWCAKSISRTVAYRIYWVTFSAFPFPVDMCGCIVCGPVQSSAMPNWRITQNMGCIHNVVLRSTLKSSRTTEAKSGAIL